MNKFSDIELLEGAEEGKPNNSFVQNCRKQYDQGGFLTSAQQAILREIGVEIMMKEMHDDYEAYDVGCNPFNGDRD